MINLATIQQQVEQAALHYGLSAGNVKILAVSKKQSLEKIKQAVTAGQRLFGESYVDEALEKMPQLGGEAIEWHFIGPIQANKTRKIAENFDWVHSVDRFKVAQRLNEQRPMELGPLNVCVEVNISGETSKSGIRLDELEEFVSKINDLERIKCRGLMTIPAITDDFEQQRQPYKQLRQAFEELNAKGYQLDTLSMGMSNDFKAAIAEGATIVRIGTAIFGERSPL